ncbi:MAG: hypothetical protein GVY04_21250 [Cyanobacteria bacterium]|nr:hypothetical protein [Cyanobacteria bacterium GSL.Bin1]
MIISNLEHLEAVSEDNAIQGGLNIFDQNIAANIASVSQLQNGDTNAQNAVVAQVNSITDNDAVGFLSN